MGAVTRPIWTGQGRRHPLPLRDVINKEIKLSQNDQIKKRALFEPAA